MHFTANKDENIDDLWEKIMQTLGPTVSRQVSPVTSSFVNTKDGFECHVRNIEGKTIAICYSESDRMGNRRWTISIRT